jgi:hypothetical protein
MRSQNVITHKGGERQFGLYAVPMIIDSVLVFPVIKKCFRGSGVHSWGYAIQEVGWTTHGY